jgi:dTDP-4-amino-4,6-dideoxygalactose transaminase
LRVDGAKVRDGAPGLARLLKERGIASAPRYIQKPAFRCEIFRDQRTFGSSRWPFTLADASAVDYREERFPGTFDALEHVLVLPWTERYTDEHVDAIGAAVRAAVAAAC